MHSGYRMGRFCLGERRKNIERKRRALKQYAAFMTEHLDHALVSFPIKCYSSAVVASLSVLRRRIRALHILSQGLLCAW